MTVPAAAGIGYIETPKIQDPVPLGNDTPVTRQELHNWFQFLGDQLNNQFQEIRTEFVNIAETGTLPWGDDIVDVGAANAGGSSAEAAREDHVHAGVISYGKADDVVQGAITVAEGAAIDITRAANAFTFAVELGDTIQDVGSANAAGSGTEAAKDDHVHEGVHSIAGAGEAEIHGDATLTGGSNVTLTQVAKNISIAATDTNTQTKLLSLALHWTITSTTGNPVAWQDMDILQGTNEVPDIRQSACGVSVPWSGKVIGMSASWADLVNHAAGDLDFQVENVNTSNTTDSPLIENLAENTAGDSIDSTELAFTSGDVLRVQVRGANISSAIEVMASVIIFVELA